MQKIQIKETENLGVGVLVFTENNKSKVKQYVDLKKRIILVVPIDGNDVYLLKEYRPLLDKIVWRLPAGTLKPKENPLKGAVRELREEAGLIPKKIALISHTEYMGWVKFPIYVYKANGVKKVKQKLDFYERIELKKVSKKEAIRIALKEMVEPHHSFALLKCLLEN